MTDLEIDPGGQPTIDPERDAFDVRSSSAEILARVGADEARGRGRLRIYLGMASGVGKTHRMLDEGHQRIRRGTDLVAGFVETHGRTVVAARLEGLEVVSRRRIEYRGLVVEEMDTDAILEREPTVALIDELAHANVPGSVRERRWEDVEVIRDAGIHVVSTMNVQHLASVADAVATITGAPVNERLPDDVLLDADEIELVDLSPDALRRRMTHGNVFPPERTRVALDKFFTEANLTALRELALRVVARRVEGQLEDMNADQQLPLITDRVLVLIDASPASRRAVRRAAGLAGALHAAFIGLVVETPDTEREPFDRGRDLRETVDDAVDLGADIVRLEAPDVVAALEQIARARRATHVVLPHRDVRRVRRFIQRPLADELIERLPELEIHVVAATPDAGDSW
jgi:two-component system sensor histidine kinase KdpD